MISLNPHLVRWRPQHPHPTDEETEHSGMPKVTQLVGGVIEAQVSTSAPHHLATVPMSSGWGTRVPQT